MKEAPTYEQETYHTHGNHVDPLMNFPATRSRFGTKQAALIVSCGGLIVLLAFALYVWPTPYQTYQQNGNTLRVNRFTGNTQALGPDGWVTPASQLPQALDTGQFSALSVDDAVITHGNLHTRIYNGTSSRLDDVTLLLTILNKDRTVKVARPYLVRPEDAGNGGPYGESGFGTRCGFSLAPGETWRITVAGATGTITPGLSPVAATVTAPVPQPAPIAPAKPTVSVAAPSKAPVPTPAAPAKVAVAHSMPLTAGVVPPHPVPPLASAIKPPVIKPLPPTPSAITSITAVDPAQTGGLTPLQLSSLQQRYDTLKRDGKFATDPQAQAWGLAALARNFVRDDNQADLTKVPTPVLENSLHMINTYKPADFLR